MNKQNELINKSLHPQDIGGFSTEEYLSYEYKEHLMIDRCEFCKISPAVLEGYFYAVAENFVTKGTATAGLLQLRKVCKFCAEEAIACGRTPAKTIEKNI